nr:malonyl-coenzyme:anthocyanin 5-O-glucoside-6'''-O-malonyltransferase [Oryza sativa Japonica Group]
MASGAEVRVVAAIRVPLLRRSPPHLEQIPLSLFDVWFLPQPPIQRLFLYDDDGGGGGADDYFPSLVESLRSSLADAVAVFFPLAGKLTYVPSTGDVVVDCSPSAVGDGVAFLEAESDGDARALSAAKRHDVPAFLRLVPSLEAPELPAPVLAVQVTRFVGGGDRGGVAVGVAVHHAVADGLSFWRFMDVWSAAARGRPSPPAPVFDRSAIVHPMAADVARRILRKVTPELPLLPTANWLRRTWQHHDTTTRRPPSPTGSRSWRWRSTVARRHGRPPRGSTSRRSCGSCPAWRSPSSPRRCSPCRRRASSAAGAGAASRWAWPCTTPWQTARASGGSWTRGRRRRAAGHLPPRRRLTGRRSCTPWPLTWRGASSVRRHRSYHWIPTANLLRRTWERHVVTTLELDSHRIGHIKNRIAELDEATTASPGTERRPRRLPSTFVAVAALVWSSVVRARASRQPDDGARAHLVFPADCRRRLDPPVDAAYFGNCVRCCVAGAAAGDLADAHRGVLHAREAIREAIDGFLEHPMVEAFDAWIDAVAALVRQPGFVAVTASPRFQVYEVDLGWGAPSRVEFASESLPNGMVAMTAGRKEASVQVMATLRPEHMEAFRSQLLYW